MTVTEDIENALSPALAGLFALPDLELLEQSIAAQDALRAAVAEVSAHRRMAVRNLRIGGWTLKEIAEVLGTTPQRVHQLESGYDRQEKRARARK